MWALGVRALSLFLPLIHPPPTYPLRLSLLHAINVEFDLPADEIASYIIKLV